MRWLLVIAFVILTNPLFAQKPVYGFVPSSIQSIYFDAKDCKHFDDTGVGCSTAFIVFGQMSAREQILPEEEDVVFKPGGEWEMTVRYHPRQCSSVGRLNTGLIVFRCKNVSWRTAK